jgi:hypothetical protein
MLLSACFISDRSKSSNCKSVNKFRLDAQCTQTSNIYLIYKIYDYCFLCLSEKSKNMSSSSIYSKSFPTLHHFAYNIGSSCFFLLRIYRRREKNKKVYITLQPYTSFIPFINILVKNQYIVSKTFKSESFKSVRSISFHPIMRFSPVLVRYRLRETMKTTNETYYWS